MPILLHHWLQATCTWKKSTAGKPVLRSIDGKMGRLGQYKDHLLIRVVRRTGDPIESLVSLPDPYWVAEAFVSCCRGGVSYEDCGMDVWTVSRRANVHMR